MKAEEKTLIFNLLKTAGAVVNNGFVPASFCNTPDFSDDISESEEKCNTETENLATVKQAAEIKENSDHSQITIESLQAKILRCTRCGLARTRNNVVPGQGVNNPDVMVIGEGPGYDEDMQGFPFVGKAGMLLDKMLAAIQLDRKTNCYIANIVKCRPPQNRDPLPEEQDACISFLEAQIHILKPKLILCMGRISGHRISGTELPMREMHGHFYDYNGIPAMVTYHPSALLRDESLKRPAWDDLKIFKQKLNSLTNG